MTSTDLNLALRGADTVLPPGRLEELLEGGRPLRVKLGLDPTAPMVTLGWAVVLRKLRHFQEMGHTAVLIVGDFTARVGDPSGKSETRKRLTAAEVQAYAEPLLEQFRRVLLPEPLEVRWNSEWLESLDMTEILELASTVTVAQMLERSDFANRYSDRTPISILEFLYPLLQGYDSVAVKADVELGGSDQLWNLMMGRIIQTRYGQKPQVALTVPLLTGTDGHHKMSQSLDNYIGVTEPASEMFGKTMSIPDHLLGEWFRLAADRPAEEVDEIIREVGSGALHPAAAKRQLAKRIVSLYWGQDDADAAQAEFDRRFKYREVPRDAPPFALPADDPVYLPGLLRSAKLAPSASQGRRLIDAGAVRVEGQAIKAYEVPRDLLVKKVLMVGKRRSVFLQN
ncbi:MAG: tyrosine--tRNA ligase [bacterium]|nr:tyrosine--tRNA ligase [Acidimicrobiia bacterium]MCY4648909.1 tyrosine--tRNA ligase [bacterium]